jgi:hypothetical protein
MCLGLHYDLHPTHSRADHLRDENGCSADCSNTPFFDVFQLLEAAQPASHRSRQLHGGLMAKRLSQMGKEIAGSNNPLAAAELKKVML